MDNGTGESGYSGGRMMSNLIEQIDKIESDVREIKSTWGKTIMTLDNIKTALKADMQKKVDEAYQKGLADGKKSIMEFVGKVNDDPTGENLLFKDFKIALEISNYMKQKKADEEIKVGDEVKIGVEKGVVTKVAEDYKHMNVVMGNGSTGWYKTDSFTRTGKHFDIDKILEEMKSE